MKGLSKGRYDETFAGEDDLGVVRLFHLLRKGNQILFIIW